jgi:hypothetical protein
MPYLGNQPTSGGYHKLDSLTASATDTYGLTLGGSAYYPATANQLLVSLNGVIQAPQDSFTISGSNIVFASALSASDSIDFIMSFGDVYGVGTPADGTITNAKIQSMAASKLTGALPAIDGSALTGLSGSNVLEVISGVCDGSTHTVNGTSYTFPNVTAKQTTTTSYADVTGSSFTYTPPSDATRVEYDIIIQNASSSNRHFNHFKFYLDSDEVVYARTSFGDFTNSYEEPFHFKWVLGIGGSADTNVGRVASWTTSKTMKLQVRAYSASDVTDLHHNVYWDGTAPAGGHFRLPTLKITAYK